MIPLLIAALGALGVVFVLSLARVSAGADRTYAGVARTPDSTEGA